MSKKSKIFIADSIPKDERPLGRMLADSKGDQFMPLRALGDAQAEPDGYVILQGDDGGQIYVVAPALYVQCSPATLDRLLRELDEIEWPGNPEDMRKIFFERIPPGTGVAGGMGGGIADTDPWVHERLVAQGLRPAILAVLRAEREAVR